MAQRTVAVAVATTATLAGRWAEQLEDGRVGSGGEERQAEGHEPVGELQGGGPRHHIDG